jgi:hypothetical protein
MEVFGGGSPQSPLASSFMFAAIAKSVLVKH